MPRSSKRAGSAGSPAIAAPLSRPHGPWLTHACLAVLTTTMLALLVYAPLPVGLLAGTLLHHRIGILLHEYIHGIPLRGYRRCLLVLALFDGILMSFGMLELFRATHLAHHRWLNTEGDPAFDAAETAARRRSRFALVSKLELSQHIGYLAQALSGDRPYASRRRMLAGACLSIASGTCWVALGCPWVPLGLAVLALYTAIVSSSLRGAVEHHARPGDPGFANEYRPLIPMFNINRHIHHHMDPTCPWYRLRFVTGAPLPASRSLTQWFDVYVRRRYVLMRPMVRGKAEAEALDGWS